MSKILGQSVFSLKNLRKTIGSINLGVPTTFLWHITSNGSTALFQYQLQHANSTEQNKTMSNQ